MSEAVQCARRRFQRQNRILILTIPDPRKCDFEVLFRLHQRKIPAERIAYDIAMDCRRALSASVANNTLTITVPVYYDSNSDPKTPALTNGALSYGTGSVTITYSQSGSNFNRRIVVSDSGGTTTSDTATAIATNVASFTVSPQDLTSSVSCSITFSPRFTYLPGPGPISGTTVYCNTFLRNAGARH